jgi:hypothetical protein
MDPGLGHGRRPKFRLRNNFRRRAAYPDTNTRCDRCSQAELPISMLYMDREWEYMYIDI